MFFFGGKIRQMVKQEKVNDMYAIKKMKKI